MQDENNTQEIEVTVGEEKQEGQIREVAQEQTQQENTEQQNSVSEDSEKEEYSFAVKKRIDKLTKRLREAERREEAALQYAQGVKKDAESIKQKYDTLDKNYIDEFGSRVDNQLDLAKNKLKNAIANRDVDSQIEANQEIARLTIDAERLKYSKAAQEEQQKTEETQPVSANTAPQVPRKPDPKAVEWAERNQWFGEDEVMTETAKAIHRRLVTEKSIDPSTDMYYDQLDKELREYFPHKFGEKTETTKVAQPVASATRTNKTSGRRTVKLSSSQVAMAKRLGVPIEEYAKYVKGA